MGAFKVLPKVCYSLFPAKRLLEGITSNDLKGNKNAFLDRFGKLIILFDQKIIDDTAYIVFEDKYETRFFDHLLPYVKLTKAKVEKMKGKVIHVIEGDEGEIRFPQNIGYITLADRTKGKELSEDEYEMIRIEDNIPLQGKDFDNEMFLDTGIDAVSYTKGCYLGQEVMSRIHNTGKPGRKIVRIAYEKIPEKVTCDKEIIGKITSKCFSKKHRQFLVFAMIRYDVKKIDGGDLLG